MLKLLIFAILVRFGLVGSWDDVLGSVIGYVIINGNCVRFFFGKV